jgi:hypothetical protein
MGQQIGIQIDGTELQMCLGSQNDTVKDCPVSKEEYSKKKEFIVLAHNAQSQ